MTRGAAILAALLLLVAGAAAARAPESSLRPMARPGSTAVQAAPAIARTPDAQADAQTETPTAKPQRKGLFHSLRPNPRPKGLKQNAVKQRAASLKGAVCGDPDIKGEPVGPVPAKIRGCGVAQAVKVRSVRGVALSTPAVMDCATAKSLKSWVGKGLSPAVGNHGGGVREMRIMASYACRPRNNQKGAKISEHGKGRAVDIGGFTLKDGTQISVLKDWGKGRGGKILKQAHKSACGPFGTVLGPAANGYHRDHFHFDTARYRSGSYCR